MPMARDTKLCLILSAAYFLIILPLIATVPVGSSSEAREVHIAKIMYESGEYILPFRNGLLPSKPPLFHWLTAGLAHITGGVNEFTSRLVSLLFACMTIFVTARMALKFSVSEDRRYTALLAALILGTSYEFLRLASDSRVDMVFCFFVSLAGYFIYTPLSPQAQKYQLGRIVHSRSNFLLFYLACSGAVLTKGPLGIILPVLVCFAGTSAYYGFKKSITLWLQNAWTAVVFLLIAPAWYYLAYDKVGIDFIAKQLLFENLDRFTGDELMRQVPFWFYLPSFVRFAFPWSVFFLVSAFVDLAAKLTRSEGQSSFEKRLVNLLYFWFFTGVLFFTVSFGKRHSYLVPLFIPVSVLLAVKLADRRFITINKKAVLRDFLTAALLFIGIVVLCLPHLNLGSDVRLNFAADWIRENEFFLLLSCLSPFIVKLLLNISGRDSFWKTDFMLCLCLQATLAAATLGALGVKNQLKNFKFVAEDLERLVGPKSNVVALRKPYEELTDPIMYYYKGTMPIQDPDRASYLCNSYYVFEEKYRLGLSALKLVSSYTQPLDFKKGRLERTIHLGYYDCSRS